MRTRFRAIPTWPAACCLAALALPVMVLAAGCGGRTLVSLADGSGGGNPDLTGGGGGDDGGPDVDLAVETPDMAFPEDMAAACVSRDKVGTGKTGEPCAKNTDCRPGTGPMQPGKCLLSTTAVNGDIVLWPSGYCSTACRVDLNDVENMQGLNPDCPGGNGTCMGAPGDIGQCVAFCSANNNCRGCYSCILASGNNHACQPAALGQCDPRMTYTCPWDDNGKPQVCRPTGTENTGRCAPACDPYKNAGCPTIGGSKGDCHINELTGEGFCSEKSQVGAVAGDKCGIYYTDCPGGYGCLQNQCWKYCNLSNISSQCEQGARCMQFPIGTLDVAVAGICSASK